MHEIFVWEVDFSNRGTERRGGQSVNFSPPFLASRAHYHPSRGVRFAKSHAKSKDFLSLVAESHSTAPGTTAEKAEATSSSSTFAAWATVVRARAHPSALLHAPLPPYVGKGGGYR